MKSYQPHPGRDPASEEKEIAQHGDTPPTRCQQVVLTIKLLVGAALLIVLLWWLDRVI